MLRANKVAIARFVMRTKQYLAALRPSGSVLVLSTMLYADEVVPVDRLDGLPDIGDDASVSKKELAMAESLIASLSVDTFEPEKFHDDYRERVLDMIERKAAGETIDAPVAADTGGKVLDL